MRIFMGVVWFIVCYIVFTIAYVIVLGMVITSVHPVAGYAEGVQAGIAFAHQHVLILSLIKWAIFAAAIVFAVLGTWKRVLPGTREKPAVSEQPVVDTKPPQE